MKEQENTALVQQAYALFGKGDLVGLMKLMSRDVFWEIPEVENVPFTGIYQGPEAVGRFFAALDKAVETLKFEPQEFLAKGDKVVVLGERQYKTREHGRTYGGKWVEVITVKDGKLTRFEDYADTAAAAKAFKPE